MNEIDGNKMSYGKPSLFLPSETAFLFEIDSADQDISISVEIRHKKNRH
jgi:hypothetical protein